MTHGVDKLKILFGQDAGLFVANRGPVVAVALDVDLILVRRRVYGAQSVAGTYLGTDADLFQRPSGELLSLQWIDVAH